MVEGGLTEAVLSWLLALEFTVWPHAEARTQGRGRGAAPARTSGHWERLTANVSVLGGGGGNREITLNVRLNPPPAD